LQLRVQHLTASRRPSRISPHQTRNGQGPQTFTLPYIHHGESSPMTSPKERKPSPSSALSIQPLRIISYRSPGDVTIWPTSRFQGDRSKDTREAVSRVVMVDSGIRMNTPLS